MTSRERSLADEQIFDAWQAELAKRRSSPTGRSGGFISYFEFKVEFLKKKLDAGEATEES